MAKKGDNKLFLVSLVVVIVLVGMYKMISSEPTTEEVREKMKKELYKEYEEEFKVGRIGLRSYGERKMYEARVYPKAIIGTPKEGDKYYYSQAALEKKSFGRLGKLGGGYENVKIRLEAEKYIEKKVNKTFGNRVLIKTEVKYKRRQKDSDFFGWKIVSGFEKLLEKTIEDPKHNRIELELYIYVFDRIDDDKEKEERKEDIFEFIQYLKKEGLFEYLEMGVIFIDERVLAPSYNHYKWKVEDSVKVKKEVEGEKLKLPPMDLREEMSRVLGDELEEMSEEEMIRSMNGIQKSDLSYDGISKNNAQYIKWIYSIGMLKTNYNTAYQEDKRNGELEYYKYDEISKVDVLESLEYIYIN